MPRIATSTLIAIVLLAGQARAAAVQSYLYNTTGTLGGTSGPNPGFPISFLSQGTAMLTTPGTFSLGTIVTNPLPDGATLTFDSTGFTVNLNVGPVPATGYDPSNPYTSLASAPYTYTIQGVLNGSLKGDGTSTLFATVTSVLTTAGLLPFPTSALKFDLQGIAAPNGSTYGSTLLTARIESAGTPLPPPAPEPTSVAAFAAALAGWAWKRRRAARLAAA